MKTKENTARNPIQTLLLFTLSSSSSSACQTTGLLSAVCMQPHAFGEWKLVLITTRILFCRFVLYMCFPFSFIILTNLIYFLHLVYLIHFCYKFSHFCISFTLLPSPISKHYVLFAVNSISFFLSHEQSEKNPDTPKVNGGKRYRNREAAETNPRIRNRALLLRTSTGKAIWRRCANLQSNKWSHRQYGGLGNETETGKGK